MGTKDKGEIIMSELRNPMRGVQTGEVSGSATAKVLPAIVGSMIWIKAVASNVGNVYLGIAGVTVVNGTTDITSGFELVPGEQIGPLVLDNMSRLYIICDNAGDDITYFVMG